jgi:hypothetical protein
LIPDRGRSIGPVKFQDDISHFAHLKRMAQDKPSAIMCYDEDYRQCNWHLLKERLGDDGFKVICLGGDQKDGFNNFNIC